MSDQSAGHDRCVRQPRGPGRYRLIHTRLSDARTKEITVTDEIRPEAVLVRHGETEWSAAGRHTGRTDISLAPAGRAGAALLAARLAHMRPALTLTSPLRRARETAELAGRPAAAPDPDLAEWNYGDYEGLTTTEIRIARADWSLWVDGAPGGEDAARVAVRADRVIARMLAAEGDSLMFSHGHLLRVLAARWVGLAATDGQLLALSAGSVSVLGWERETRVVRLWNDVAHLTPLLTAD